MDIFQHRAMLENGFKTMIDNGSSINGALEWLKKSNCTEISAIRIVMQVLKTDYEPTLQIIDQSELWHDEREKSRKIEELFRDMIEGDLEDD